MKNINDFDSIIINLGTILLTGFLGFAFVVDGHDNLTVYLITLTTLFLLVSIILSCWFKIRSKLRKSIFNKKVKDFSHTTLKSTLVQFEKYAKGEARIDFQDYADEFMSKYGEMLSGKSEDEIKFLLDIYFDKNEGRRNRDNKDEFIRMLSHGLSAEFEKIYKESLQAPLDEPFARTKWLLDKFSFKFRVYVFLLSLTLFLVTSTLLIG